MTPKRLNYLMKALAVISIGLFVATILLGNSFLTKQSNKLVEAKLDLESLNQQQTALIRAKQDLEKYKNLKSIANVIVPQDKDQAKSVREIVRLASESGVSIAGINFDASTLGLRTTPNTSTTGESPVTQARPVPGISGVYAVDIAIESQKESNTYANFIRFLEKLENNRRTAQVSQVKVTPGRTPGGFEFIEFALKVSIFVKP